MTVKNIVIVNGTPQTASDVPQAGGIPIANSSGGIDNWISAKGVESVPGYIVVADNKGTVINWIPLTQYVNVSGTTTTTSTTDVLVTGVTITPDAGMYEIFFTSTMGGSASANVVTASIYVGGVQISGSLRSTTVTAGTSLRAGFYCIGQATVDGTMAVEGRWNTSAGTGTMADRTLGLRLIG